METGVWAGVEYSCLTASRRQGKLNIAYLWAVPLLLIAYCKFTIHHSLFIRFLLPFQFEIIQEIDHFKRQIIVLISLHRFIDVLEIIFLNIPGEMISCVLPNYIDEAARREFPGVHHIHVEKVHILVHIPIECREWR